MSFSTKVSSLVAHKISKISTNVANTSTKACYIVTLEEPKMPKSLLKKAK